MCVVCVVCVCGGGVGLGGVVCVCVNTLPQGNDCFKNVFDSICLVLTNDDPTVNSLSC